MIRHVPTFVVSTALALALGSGAAFACSGTQGYEQAEQTLQQSTMPEAKKKELQSKFEAGRKLHEQGHAESDTGKMRKSLQVLDEINKQL